MRDEVKVLQIIDTLTIGGAEKVFTDIIVNFSKELNMDAMIIRREESDSSNIDKIQSITKTIFLNRTNKFSIVKAYKCHIICKNYRVIHVHLRHTFKYIYFLRFIFNGSYKIILHDHYGEIEINQNPPFKFYSIIKPDYYIGVSDKLSHWAEITWKIKQNRVCNLLNLHFSKFESLAGTNRNGRWVMLGNIKVIKNQLFAIKCLQEYKINLEIIGNIQDENYLDLIKSEYKNKKINVGLIHNTIVDTKFLMKYEFGIFTSLSESGPMVLIEYIDAGIKFLAHKTGSIGAVIAEYFPEFFIDNLDTNEWRKRLIELMELQLDYNDYEKRRAALYCKYFNKEEYKLKLSNIYNHLSCGF